jgi:uncharacterized membrane protein YsdA (DUF1294 family)
MAGAQPTKMRAKGKATLLSIPAFLCLYAVIAVLWHPTAWVPVAYAVISLLTFIIYAIDKSAAKAQRRRTSEATLHLLALAGGWPGALLAQQWLRHKSAKRAFRMVFWFTVVLNVVGLVLLCSPWGWLYGK